MGLLDHRRTWRFELSGTPEQCRGAFTKALEGGSLWTRARWKLASDGSDTIGIYQGRGGIAGVLAGLSDTSRNEERTALGSELRFTIEASSGGRTTCAMWMGARGSKFGLTTDARFIRPYFRAVDAQLRSIDPSMATSKD